MKGTDTGAGASLGAQLGQIAEGLARLLGQHFALARLEVAEDARRVGKGVAGVALFAPFVLVGYGFLCAALTVWLAQRISYPLALAAVGGGNVILGAVGIGSAVRGLKSGTVMDDTVDELRRSADLLGKREAGGGGARR